MSVPEGTVPDDKPSFPEDLNLAQYFLFDRIGEGLGSKAALRYGERSYTYGLVAQRTRAMAA